MVLRINYMKIVTLFLGVILCLGGLLYAYLDHISVFYMHKKDLWTGHVVMIDPAHNPEHTMPGSLCFAEVATDKGFGYFELRYFSCKYTQEGSPEYVQEQSMNKYFVGVAIIHEDYLQKVYYRDDAVPRLISVGGAVYNEAPNEFETGYFAVQGIFCYRVKGLTHHCQSAEHDDDNWYIESKTKQDTFDKIKYPVADKAVLLDMYNYKRPFAVELK